MICLNKPKMNMGKKFRFYSSHCSYLKILGKIYQKVCIQFLNMHVRLNYKKNHCAVVSIHTINTVLKGAQWVMFPGQSLILVYQHISALRSKALHIPGCNIETCIWHFRMFLLLKTIRKEQKFKLYSEKP